MLTQSWEEEYHHSFYEATHQRIQKHTLDRTQHPYMDRKVKHYPAYLGMGGTYMRIVSM